MHKRFILFLDFDGVLCTSRQAYAVGDRGLLGCLDPVALDFLNRICRENKIWVIISSTWRIGSDIMEFHKMFKATGHFDLVNSLYFKEYATPGSKTGHRGSEIESWLESNSDVVLDYMIIDDEDHDIYEFQKEKMTKTDGRNGILFEHYIKIEKTVASSMGKDYVE